MAYEETAEGAAPTTGVATPDPVFETWAEFEVWAVKEARHAGITPRARIAVADRIRRVTLAHLHLKD